MSRTGASGQTLGHFKKCRYLTNHLLENIEVWIMLASTQLSQMHGYMTELKISDIFFFFFWGGGGQGDLGWESKRYTCL